MMGFYLHWSLVCYYLDDFIYDILAFEVCLEKLQSDIQAYKELIVLLRYAK